MRELVESNQGWRAEQVGEMIARRGGERKTAERKISDLLKQKDYLMINFRA